jgi:hypothetical protein
MDDMKNTHKILVEYMKGIFYLEVDNLKLENNIRMDLK